MSFLCNIYPLFCLSVFFCRFFGRCHFFLTFTHCYFWKCFPFFVCSSVHLNSISCILIVMSVCIFHFLSPTSVHVNSLYNLLTVMFVSVFFCLSPLQSMSFLPNIYSVLRLFMPSFVYLLLSPCHISIQYTHFYVCLFFPFIVSCSVHVIFSVTFTNCYVCVFFCFSPLQSFYFLGNIYPLLYYVCLCFLCFMFSPCHFSVTFYIYLLVCLFGFSFVFLLCSPCPFSEIFTRRLVTCLCLLFFSSSFFDLCL